MRRAKGTATHGMGSPAGTGCLRRQSNKQDESNVDEGNCDRWSAPLLGASATAVHGSLMTRCVIAPAQASRIKVDRIMFKRLSQMMSNTQSQRVHRDTSQED
ncbi:hypothetical protein, partial [Burkholderia stagnalis]|uniref:hypothetical protein n=1 Tax=Burkholderia stagnalis TaxID=1503054 RepID=UPI001C89692B